MRVVALDYGAARCGVAVCDPSGTVVTPREPVLAPGTRRGFGRAVATVQEAGAELVLVGLPLALGGHDTPQTAETRAWADRLAARVAPVPVELHDERLTTRMAARLGGTASEDSRAAAVLLEGWLAARGRGSAAPPTESAH